MDPTKDALIISNLCNFIHSKRRLQLSHSMPCIIMSWDTSCLKVICQSVLKNCLLIFALRWGSQFVSPSLHLSSYHSKTTMLILTLTDWHWIPSHSVSIHLGINFLLYGFDCRKLRMPEAVQVHSDGNLWNFWVLVPWWSQDGVDTDWYWVDTELVSVGISIAVMLCIALSQCYWLELLTSSITL